MKWILIVGLCMLILLFGCIPELPQEEKEYNINPLTFKTIEEHNQSFTSVEGYDILDGVKKTCLYALKKDNINYSRPFIKYKNNIYYCCRNKTICNEMDVYSVHYIE